MNNDTHAKMRDQVQRVLDICYDGVKGYDHAAERTENPDFKTIFHRLAQQRKLFIEELKYDMLDQGLHMETDGTTKGYFHRTWLDIKSAFAGKTDESILEEAKTGEREAVEVYDSVIQTQVVPDYIEERLKKQRDFIKGAIRQLDGFEVNAAR